MYERWCYWEKNQVEEKKRMKTYNSLICWCRFSLWCIATQVRLLTFFSLYCFFPPLVYDCCFVTRLYLSREGENGIIVFCLLLLLPLIACSAHNAHAIIIIITVIIIVAHEWADAFLLFRLEEDDREKCLK